MAAWLKNTCHVLTDTIRPPLTVNPPGWFIHELTAITDIAPNMPLAAIGTPLQRHRHRVGPAQADERSNQPDRRERYPHAGQNDVEPEGGRHLSPSRDHLVGGPRNSDHHHVSEAHYYPPARRSLHLHEEAPMCAPG